MGYQTRHTDGLDDLPDLVEIPSTLTFYMSEDDRARIPLDLGSAIYRRRAIGFSWPETKTDCEPTQWGSDDEKESAYLDLSGHSSAVLDDHTSLSTIPYEHNPLNLVGQSTIYFNTSPPH
jgi:hypothetical protein